MVSRTGSAVADVFGILSVPLDDAPNVAGFGRRHNALLTQAAAIK